MKNLLDLIYEYQLLVSKERHLEILLDDEERARLMGLRRLLEGERLDLRRREMPRFSLLLPVRFTLPGGFEEGHLENISGGGLCLRTYVPPKAGTSLIVRFVDPSSGVEYVYPCSVAWREGRQVGLRFDGVPSRTELVEENSGVWERTFHLGDRRQEPMVA